MTAIQNKLGKNRMGGMRDGKSGSEKEEYPKETQ